jgi:hypothetical protein
MHAECPSRGLQPPVEGGEGQNAVHGISRAVCRSADPRGPLIRGTGASKRADGAQGRMGGWADGRMGGPFGREAAAKGLSVRLPRRQVGLRPQAAAGGVQVVGVAFGRSDRVQCFGATP